MKTMKGELSLAVSQIRMLTKSLRPLPEKHKGLTDTETRYRQRYLDLMVNEDSRLVFVRRAKIVDQIRRFFVDRDFMEVETPMMQTTPRGRHCRAVCNALQCAQYRDVLARGAGA